MTEKKQTAEESWKAYCLNKFGTLTGLVYQGGLDHLARARAEEREKWEKATLDTINKWGIKPRGLSEEEICNKQKIETAKEIFEELERWYVLVEGQPKYVVVIGDYKRLRAKWVKKE